MSFESGHLMGHGMLGTTSAPAVPERPCAPITLRQASDACLAPKARFKPITAAPFSPPPHQPNLLLIGHHNSSIPIFNPIQDDPSNCIEEASLCQALLLSKYRDFPFSDASLGSEDSAGYPSSTALSARSQANTCIEAGTKEFAFVCPQDLELQSPTPAIDKEDSLAADLKVDQDVTLSSGRPFSYVECSVTNSCPSDQTCTRKTSDASNVASHHALPKRISPIKSWLRDHASSPYATEEEVADLAAKTGLSDRQVRVCLSNLRTRKKTSGDLPHTMRLSTTTGNRNCRTHSVSKRYQLNFESEEWPLMSLDHWDNPYGFRALPSKGTSSFASTSVGTCFDLQLITNPMGINLHNFPSFDFPSAGDEAQVTLTPTSNSSKRKGKRFYPSRYRQDAGEWTSTFASDESNEGTKESTKAFQCTVCPKSFKDVYGWKRHEAGVHSFHVTEWTCMLDGIFLDGVKCAFCLEDVDDPEHFNRHHILTCLNKDHANRTFARKDLLKQHVGQVHLTGAEDWIKKAFQVPDFWAKDVDGTKSDPASLWCGFCQKSLKSTALRMEHVANHFREGLEICLWHPLCTA